MGHEFSIDIGMSQQRQVASVGSGSQAISTKTEDSTQSPTLVVVKEGDEGGGHVSTYTVETEQSAKDSVASAPCPYRRLSFKMRTKRKLRRCCWRKRHKPDQDNMSLLRSFSGNSNPGGFAMHSTTEDFANSSDDEDVDCFGSREELEGVDSVPVSIRIQIRSPDQLRRTRVPCRPDVSMNLWAIIKNAIGKDLTKLPLPVNFNEPLSMLQRLTEDFEYSSLLDRAAKTDDPCEQMACIAAYTVSSYATSAVRTGKPFNPLLGETFECDRTDDLGWRCISEQVSHHPPLAAQHCQGRKWTCWQQFSMSSKFRGNSIEIVPLGLAHLVFMKSGVHYTWRKVPSVVHNIMIGKLWIDQDGEMDIYNHTTGETCHIKYITTSFFRGESRRVEGTVFDSERNPKLYLSGAWDAKMEVFEILKVDSKDRMTLGPAKLLWTRVMPPLDSDCYYNFTILACQLNEMEEGIAPTDSRNRPDQRLMENGYFDEANTEKLRLEEKQRYTRKMKAGSKSKSTMTTRADDGSVNEAGEPNYTPSWFSLQKDPVTGNVCHMFTGEYWTCKKTQDWSRCPDIF